MRLPRFLDPRRLEGRIVAMCLGLLLAVQLLSFYIIGISVERNAEASISAQLETGERMHRRLLVSEAEKRSDAARVLASDYGFIETIGKGEGVQDVATIKDALRNHGDRIGASVVVYTDQQLHLVATTRDEQVQAFVKLLAPMTRRAKCRGSSDPVQGPNLAIVGDMPYQVVAVPVCTPAPNGWVLMAFAMDASTLQDLKQLSRLDAIIVNNGPDWHSLVSSLPAEAASVLAPQITADGTLFKLNLAGEHLRGRYVSLVREGSQEVGAVLLRSFDEAVAPYRKLQWTLLGLTGAGAAAFALLSIPFARRITEPIKALAESAKRLGRGDYDTPIERRSFDEVAALAGAFEAMRVDIRGREEQVHRLAFWDPLTGLPNREQFSQRLHEQLAEGQPFAVLMLDLDRFKHVNDVLGHAFGDKLLCSVAQRLGQISPSERGMLARLGGDEFVLLLERADARAAQALAQRILTDFEQPLHIEDQTVDIGAGIGIALSPAHGQEVSLLMSRAELAMYSAKRRQCGSMTYEASLDAGSQESLSLLTELRRAVENDELRLFLQPKVDLKSGAVISAEALVRWEHPQRGLVPPMEFIPFAEQTGFIRQLTAWVLAESAHALKLAQGHGFDLRISVNLSTRDLLDQDLPTKIDQLLAGYSVTPQGLCLEITESAIMDDPQRALQTLERLSEMGFKLSIDDFGTGYSSLAYLKRLPVNELKIDKSFVMAMERDLDDARIVRSTIELAHNLGLTVVAEGVETGKAWKLLAELGCDEGQGYFISRPMPTPRFFEWLQGWQAPDLSGETLDTAFADLG